MNFLKYVCRILKKFPRDDNYCYRHEGSHLKFIEKQLTYIHKTIIPFFATKSHDNRNNDVTKDKLIQLWLNKRKKAIKIIKNNGEWPRNVNVTITTNTNEEYFESSIKYNVEDNFTAGGEQIF